MIKTYRKRQIYIDKIRPFIGKGIIKILTGQRRVGKSYLLFQIMDEIKKIDKNASIIYINKEDVSFDSIKTYKDLYDYIIQKKHNINNNYIFIDEVQEIASYEKAIRDLSSKKGIDFYITGSNASLLSSDLATHLTGRYIEIPVYGLSYKEFLEFHSLTLSDETFLKYIKYGGLPYLIHLELKDEIVHDYLKNIYNTILLRDVVKHFKIRNVNLLERLVEYLARHVGSNITAKKISDFLDTQHINMSPNVILNYLSYLTSAFFIYEAKRSDITGKKIFEINEKYYFEDMGLRNIIVGGYKQPDINQVLENIVYFHLRLHGYMVTVGKLGTKEVDFVCQKEGKKVYIQVAYLIPNDKVRKREFGNLLDIEDNYEKIVVSTDKFIDGGVEGVRHVNILEFLNINI